jgi:DnaK suppressor protein
MLPHHPHVLKESVLSVSSDDRMEELRQLLCQREQTLKAEVQAKRGRPFSELIDLDRVGDEADEAAAISLSDLRVLEADRDLGELRAISAALRRVSDGTYGYCGDCGDEISLERLAAHPSAARCVECQRKHERIYWGGRAAGL